MLQRLSRPLDPSLGHAATENMLPALAVWRRAGEDAALATLIGIDGASPRAIGTQLAVSASGASVGSLSSGCLEAAIRQEAARAIRDRSSRVLRYGKGSPFMDIVLPCGSGLDIHVAPVRDGAWLDEAIGLDRQRRPYAVLTALADGANRVVPYAGPKAVTPSGLAGEWFRRNHVPPLRIAVVGEGGASDMLARLADATEIEVLCVREPRDLAGLDAWSAAVLLLHDHDREAPWLEAALATDCFYLGAMGSSRTQVVRDAAMMALGLDDVQRARVRGPIGLIERAKSPRDLAVSVLAEILGLAKADARFGA